MKLICTSVTMDESCTISDLIDDSGQSKLLGEAFVNSNGLSSSSSSSSSKSQESKLLNHPDDVLDSLKNIPLCLDVRTCDKTLPCIAGQSTSLQQGESNEFGQGGQLLTVEFSGDSASLLERLHETGKHALSGTLVFAWMPKAGLQCVSMVRERLSIPTKSTVKLLVSTVRTDGEFFAKAKPISSASNDHDVKEEDVSNGLVQSAILQSQLPLCACPSYSFLSATLAGPKCNLQDNIRARLGEITADRLRRRLENAQDAEAREKADAEAKEAMAEAEAEAKAAEEASAGHQQAMCRAVPGTSIPTRESKVELKHEERLRRREAARASGPSLLEEFGASSAKLNAKQLAQATAESRRVRAFNQIVPMFEKSTATIISEGVAGVLEKEAESDIETEQEEKGPIDRTHTESKESKYIY